MKEQAHREEQVCTCGHTEGIHGAPREPSGRRCWNVECSCTGFNLPAQFATDIEPVAQEPSEQRLAIANRLREAENLLLDYGLEHGDVGEDIISRVLMVLREQVLKLEPR